MSLETNPDGTLVLDHPVALPEVLDLLIVGGGPAGTAAAFRAKELGLSALVIDYDDLMKRIRDYAKDKLILPDFGGGDKMKFPAGGDLISHLHFSPIDKDEMCRAWKGFYKKLSVPAQIGVELTGMERQPDGTWAARAWNHKLKQEQVIRTRHVAIAMGRGVPRRFDIPGNTDGVAYHLDDPTKYIGQPVCVVGGGTSAAEAVIAISNAKSDAEDTTPVYWSYRGTRMPKVSRALSEVFFDAFIGNGNIRYRPNSEPVAVVSAPDRNEYLSLRVDRKDVDGRPCETSHLEFSKSFCVACIGEDLPIKFLNAVGIYMAKGGPSGKERMVVSPLLETQQPNIYLIGDLLSQAYLETDDFTADPSTFREIKHRGNIKSSLRDGVFVAEVVKQKLEGRAEIRVVLDFADGSAAGDGASAMPPPPVPAGPVDDTKPEEEDEDSLLQTILSTAPSPYPEQPAAPAPSAPAMAGTEQGFVVRMTAAGVDEDEIGLAQHGVTTIGRDASCTIAFPEDSLLSANHASISHGPDGYFLRDDGSQTGTFLKLRPGKPTPVADGDLIRAGRQILLFSSQNGGHFFVHYDPQGNPVNRYAIGDGTVVLGREAPDITLDPNDKVLSRRHLAISFKSGELTVKDLASLNGSYLRIRDAYRIEHDDVFRLGQQILRLSVREEETPSDATIFRPAPMPAARAPQPPSFSPTPAAAPAPSPGAPLAPAAAPAGEPSVTFKGRGVTFTVKPGQSICDAAEANGVDLNAECHAGICGSDPIRIVSGAEHLNAVGDDEGDALEDICGLEPGPCRLACMAQVSGPVVVEVVND